MKLIIVFFFFCLCCPLFAKDFSWLKMLDHQPKQWTQEISGNLPDVDRGSGPRVNLEPFYKEFEKDGVITIGLGWGYETWHSVRINDFIYSLNALFFNENIELSDFLHDRKKRQISFKRKFDSLRFVIDYTDERDKYISFYSDHEIVMYHGHSRYGRGPAFGSFTNYFRMGADWENIEVDSRAKYFQSEPWTLVDQYPIRSRSVKGVKINYQYFGAKKGDDKDHPELKALYTKNIQGKGVDFLNTSFLPGKQIFWYYSCRNKYYWPTTIRSKFPDPSNKFVFGTAEDGYWGNAPAAVFIMDLVTNQVDTEEIKSDMQATKDCEGCWTTY